MGTTFYFNWEVHLMEIMQEYFSGLTPFWVTVSRLGDTTLLIILFGVIYWCYDKEMGKYIGRNIFWHFLCFPMIKNLVCRRRPYFDHPQVKCLKVVDPEFDLYDIAGQGYSCPSGHSGTAVALYGSSAFRVKRKWYSILMTMAVILIGISRFAVGVHYPTDVLFGFVEGFAAIVLNQLLTYYLIQKKDLEWLYCLILICFGMLGVFFCRSNDFFSGYGVVIGGCLAFMFERKHVNFQNTKFVIDWVLRMLGGIVIYLVINSLLKLPFSEAFLDSGTIGAYLVRTGRYAVDTFLMFGIYPMCFAPISGMVERLFHKKAAQ